MSQEKDLQRIELRLDRKVVELVDKKAEIENVKRAEYIRRLIYKDIKSIIRDSRDEVDDNKIEKITEYVKEIQELRKNMRIRQKKSFIYLVQNVAHSKN